MNLCSRNSLLNGAASCVSAILLSSCGTMTAQNSLTPDHELIVLSGNDDVVSGELHNGFEYHIDTWATGASTVEFRLKVDVGSLDEADNEAGFAHFVEHMAFNGTEHYPGQELTRYLESTGMDFGGDINAHTAYDETVYQLSVPSNQPELVKEAYQVLSDWAQGITFDPAEVEAEKGVVIEEWRLGDAGEAPVWKQRYQSLYRGTDYLERFPIGTPESIQNATAESLRALYERTYRADRMTLYVSGDLELADAQYRIQQAFADVPRSDTFKPHRPDVDYSDGRYWVVGDETVTSGYLEQGRVLSFAPLTTISGQRDELFSEVLIKALQERSEQWGMRQAPVMDVEVYDYFLEDGAYAVDLTASSRGELVLSQAADVEGIWQRLIQHGVSAEEYRAYGRRVVNDLRVQGDVMADYSAYERIDWIKVFTESDLALFDWDDYVKAVRDLHNYYSHEDFNAWLADRLSQAPIIAGAVLPPTEIDDWRVSDLRSTIELASNQAVEAATVTLASDLDVPLNRRSGEVVSIEDTVVPDLKRITLSNGLTVWYFPSNVERHRVIVNLVSRGGTAVRSRRDAALDLFWAEVMMNTAPVSMTQSAYDDWQNARGISGSAYSFTTSSGLFWDGRPESLDWMLAMTAHQMQPMTFDEATVEEFRIGTSEYLKAFPDTPDGRVEAAIKPFIIDQPGFATLKPSDLTNINASSIESYHRQWLSKGTGLELFVIGNVSQDTLIDALETNLAGVPLPEYSDGQVDPYQWSGVHDLQVAAHDEDRTDIEMRIRLEQAIWDQHERLAGRITAGMLEGYLMTEIRENQGNSYDVSVGLDQAEPQVPATFLIISTSTAPSQVARVIDTIETALTEPDPWLSEERLTTAKRQAIEANRRESNNLYDILTNLEFYTRSDRSLEDYPRFGKRLAAVGLKDSLAFLERVQAAEDRLTITIEPLSGQKPES